MKPFRRAVIHVGTERTGSTSVQRALYAERQALANAGVFVPLSLVRSYERDAGVAKHVLFALALADTEHFPLDLVPLESPRQSPRDLQRDILDAMGTEFAHPDSRAHTLLISSEHIHSRLDTHGAVSRIREVLEPWVDDFVIVVVLRPQIDMAVSLANLVVRRSGLDPRLIPLFDDTGGYDRVMGVRPGYFELDDMLQRFESVFGAGAVRAARYDARGAFDSRRVLFDAIGLPAPAFPADERANASLSRDALQVMRCVHQHIDLVQNPDWRPGFIDDVDRILVREYPGPGLRPARAAAMAFMERFAAGNERIRRRHFPRQASLFEVDLERYPNESETLDDIPAWTRAMLKVLVKTWER
jgi:hypothetical protein